MVEWTEKVLKLFYAVDYARFESSDKQCFYFLVR